MDSKIKKKQNDIGFNNKEMDDRSKGKEFVIDETESERKKTTIP